MVTGAGTGFAVGVVLGAVFEFWQSRLAGVSSTGINASAPKIALDWYHRIDFIAGAGDKALKQL